MGTAPPAGAAPGTARSVPLDSAPNIVTVDPTTRTAYVSSDEGFISVVDTARCNAHRRSGCSHPVAQLSGPAISGDLAIYRRSLYVTSGVSGTDGVVSIYDISRCHAGDTTGCGPAIATVPVTDIPVGLAVSRATHTLYVGNVADHIDVLDLASCRRGRTSGCAAAVLTSIPSVDGPVFPIVDAAHHTIYAPANGPDGDGSGDQVHVIDVRHCRAADTSGCGAAPVDIQAAPGALVAHLDAATRTLYVANQSANTVSVFAVAHCTGADHSGCGPAQANVPVGADAGSGGIVQTRDGRLYVGNEGSDTLSVIATAHCRAGHTRGCPTSAPPTLRTGQQPFWLAYDRHSNTIFAANHVDGALEALNPAQCRGEGDRGCRRLLPTIPGNQEQLADDAVHTWYGADQDGNLTLTDTRVCTARHANRCAYAAIHTSEPNDGFVTPVVDDRLHTLYLIRFDPDTFAGSLVAIDTRTCNASVHTDCAPVAKPMLLPNFVAQVAINTRTHTVYVTTQDASSLQVIDGAHCNAVRQTSCSAPAGEVALDGRVFGVAVGRASNTVYVSEFGDDFDHTTVYAVDGRHCKGTDPSRCSQAPARFDSGPVPLGMVVDEANHSLYVLNNGGGDVQGYVSVYDTRTCNARDTGGCAVPAARVPVGRAPFVGALDPVTQRIFVADFAHAAVSVIDARHCNALRTSGCRDRQFDTGDLPGAVSIDPATHTAFVLNGLYGESAYFDTRR